MLFFYSGPSMTQWALALLLEMLLGSNRIGSAWAANLSAGIWAQSGHQVWQSNDDSMIRGNTQSQTHRPLKQTTQATQALTCPMFKLSPLSLGTSHLYLCVLVWLCTSHTRVHWTKARELSCGAGFTSRQDDCVTELLIGWPKRFAELCAIPLRFLHPSLRQYIPPPLP